ncbi:MAG: metallophosphoesterase [Vicinamibacterales bacterium]
MRSGLRVLMCRALASLAVPSLIAVVPACTDSARQVNPSSPVGPVAVGPTIVTSVQGAPLKAIATAAAASPVRYELLTTVSFRETAGVSARIARLVLSVQDDSGPLSAEAPVSLDLPVPALGNAAHEVRHVFSLLRPATQGRWRLKGTGVDQDGMEFDLPPFEAAVEFDGADASAPPGAGPSVSFVGAGDIARCGSPEAEATARLLDGLPGTVFTLGDNVYPEGSPQTYRDCYGPTWGRHLARTRPVAGNHDWTGDAGVAYFDYFGTAAGPRGLGFYSYDLGAWHILALNSNLHGNAGSAQHAWVRGDLAAKKYPCILAYWHHPRFSSGPNGSDANMRDIWYLLQDAGAELVLSGHDHDYERFAPQDGDGRLDLARGIRQFVVGTGGYSLYDLRGSRSNVDASNDRTWGVLRLTLHPGRYDWEFVPMAGQPYRDSGSAACSY